MRTVSTTGLGVLAGLVALFGAVSGCSSSAGTGFGGPPESDDGGSSSSSSSGGSANGGSNSSGSSGGGSSSTGSSGGGSSSSSSSGGSSSGSVGTPPPDASAPDSEAPETGSGSGTTLSDSDGFGASRAACINKINALRATNTAVALQPYTLEDTSMLDTCVDTQASNDQSKGIAHDSFMNNTPGCMWGSAMGFAQNECEQGYGTTPSGIEQCIQDMWDESLKPNCMGCVGCTQFGGACPNCDYSGSMGYECGHYVNLSAPYFTMVACGFAGSSQDSWSVQNFE